jgi:hypothetical protein
VSTLRTIAAAFESLRIPYLIGGSVASSARGIGRATFDTDIVARIAPEQVDPFASRLGKDWYVDREAAQRGIASGRAFNVIHMWSSDKYDIFPAAGAFHISQLERASLTPLETEGDVVECPVATAEDILLAKLQWYRLGGEVSDRQWNDVLGVLAANPGFDLAYAREWARQLQVEDLLEKALAENLAES